jgi:amino acid adenylation domain-containing protein
VWPVHVLFEQHAARTPEAIAVEDSHRDLQFSYSELNARSNQAAWAILDRVGTGAGRVGIVLDDSVDTLVAMLAVWKAGKTAVPLDASNPPARLQSLLLHADIEGVVGRSSASTGDDTARIDMSKLPAPDTNPGVPVGIDTAARIMYTSGSTGVPKGVVHSHRFLMRKVLADIATNGYTSKERLSQTLPLSFAASTSHTLGALANGGTLCMYDPIASGLQNLESWIRSQEITGLQLVSGLFRRFGEQLAPDAQFPSVRYVLVGGDRVLRHDIELFQQHFTTGSVFINRFAATECGPIARFVVGRDDPLPDGVVPLGMALPGRRLLIVGEDGKEVERGETGTILLYSEDLADGYWNDAELTDAFFGIGADGERFYRTGDRGRIDENGNLEHAGRGNQRVKIHGHGVDLLEVEKALLAHPSIQEVVCDVSRSDGRDDTLIAYVVLRPAVEFDRNQIRSDLATRLPMFSIPADFVPLDAMPLSPRGKLDRGALPSWTPRTLDTTSAPARSRMEEELVGLYEETLSIEGVGVHDEFWALGGTSMQALLLFSAISERFGRDLAPTALIDAPDVESLALLIEAGGASDVNRIMIPIRTTDQGLPLICVHGGGGGIFFARDISQHLRPDQPVYALQAEGFEGTSPGYRTVEELAGRYAREIVDVVPEGPYLICGLSFGGLVAIEIARILESDGREVGFLGLIDTKFPGTQENLDEGLSRHANRTLDMGLRGKVSYVVSGAWKRIVRRPYHRLRIERFVRAGRPIPVAGGWRNAYFFSLHARASREYRPSEINVPLNILSERGMATEHRRMWTPIAAAGLDILEVEGDHHDLIREPVVRDVASWLQENADRVEGQRTSP